MLFGNTQVRLRNTTTGTAIVPNVPIAKLMYYLNCICTCIEADDEDYSIGRLRDYKNYFRLSKEEEAKLVVLCLALSPDNLIGKILFQTEYLESGYSADFFELSAVSTKLVVAESLLIGGQQKKVLNIMMFTRSWIEDSYHNPMRSIQRVQRVQRAFPRPRSTPQHSDEDIMWAIFAILCMFFLPCLVAFLLASLLASLLGSSY